MLVALLAASGLDARPLASTAAIAEAQPGLIVITGDAVTELVVEAREVPALADVPILALVPAIPPATLAAALSAGATDVARLPLPSGAARGALPQR